MACSKNLAAFQTIDPGNTPSVPEHIRPASRDVSNDARSGNANRQASVPSNPQSGKTKEQKPSSNSRSKRNGSRHYLLFTM